MIMIRIRITLSNKDSAKAIDFQIFSSFMETNIIALKLCGFIRE
ncbi:hypothetical protein J2W40_001608 [Sphingobium xenophagum]|uniref:Uncharacterized protein n=1 Tax=Sphingobium xenophagum TaxID=121428 RepID=A0ABU1WZP5_SPHXE|nr:hypothetical protein [Sphingobium xenophagum]